MSRVVVFDTFGGPEVLHAVEEAVVEPGPGEIRIRVEAFAVNPLDAMMRSGTSPAPVPLPHARLGIEGTGVVDAIGPDRTGYVTGDAVIITAIPDSVARGSYAEYVTIPTGAIIARPVDLDVEHAAAIWVGYSTAYGALLEEGGLRPADRLLISGASGAVGRAAMQIANQLGATAIALTRDSSRTDELLAAGAASVIATDNDDVVEGVRRLTGGVGADVVLDLVRGPGQLDLLAATRPEGTLVAAGFLDPRPTPESRDTPVRIINYRGFDKLSDPVAVNRMAAFMDAGVRHGALLPAIDEVFAMDDIADAHRRFDEGRHGGRKIVVRT